MSYQEDRLLEIADAIRAKDGTTDPIKATDFAERIEAIPSGSALQIGDITQEDKSGDSSFHLCDGSVVTNEGLRGKLQYTVADAQELTANRVALWDNSYNCWLSVYGGSIYYSSDLVNWTLSYFVDNNCGSLSDSDGAIQSIIGQTSSDTIGRINKYRATTFYQTPSSWPYSYAWLTAGIEIMLGNGYIWKWRGSGEIYDSVYNSSGSVFYSAARDTRNGRIVVTGRYVVLRSEDDGANWINTANTVGDLRSVVFGNNVFVAVGSSGYLYTSDDGISWVKRTSFTSVELRKIVYKNGVFATANSSGVWTSSDGINWDIKSSVGGTISRSYPDSIICSTSSKMYVFPIGYKLPKYNSIAYIKVS